MYAAVVFNLHLNWLLMAFCRLDGSRVREEESRCRCTEQSNTETASRTCGGTLAGFNVPAPMLFCRIRALERGSRKPFAQERENGQENRQRRRRTDRGPAAMLFLFTHPLYQHSESRLPKVYARGTSARGESLVYLSLSLETRFRAASFRKFNRATPPHFIPDGHHPLTVNRAQVRRRINKMRKT